MISFVMGAYKIYITSSTLELVAKGIHENLWPPTVLRIKKKYNLSDFAKDFPEII